MTGAPVGVVVVRRAHGEALRLVLAALHELGPRGGLLSDVARVTGIVPDLLSVLLRGYVRAGHVWRAGHRPTYRYFAQAAWRDAWAARPPEPPAALAEPATVQVRRLMRALGVRLRDLLPEGAELVLRGTQKPAPLQLVTPAGAAPACAVAPVAVPVVVPKPARPARALKSAVALGLLQVPAGSIVPPKVPAWPGNAVSWRDQVAQVPEGLQVQVCPSGQDLRYRVDAAGAGQPGFGLGLGADWRRKTGQRGRAHGGR